VAYCRIHEGHVLSLHAEDVALDPKGDVLNLDHYFVRNTSFFRIHTDKLDLEETNLFVVIRFGLDEGLDLVHLLGLRHLL